MMKGKKRGRGRNVHAACVVNLQRPARRGGSESNQVITSCTAHTHTHRDTHPPTQTCIRHCGQQHTVMQQSLIAGDAKQNAGLDFSAAPRDASNAHMPPFLLPPHNTPQGCESTAWWPLQTCNNVQAYPQASTWRTTKYAVLLEDRKVCCQHIHVETSQARRQEQGPNRRSMPYRDAALP